MTKLFAGLTLALGLLLAGDASEMYAVDQLDAETVTLVRESDAAVVLLPRTSLPDAEEGAIYRWAIIWTRDTAAEATIRAELDSLRPIR